MKKITLILITLIILTNVSYASFPVSDTLKPKLDTIKTETIEQYHYRIQKEGFNLNDCRCESCRAGIPVSVEFAEKPIDYHKNISKIFLVTAAIGLVMMLYGIFIVSEIGSGLGGLLLLIASVIVLLINFFIKILKK